ncbi:DNA-binding/iron metalloprotein/AP endonuclease [Candidatus Tremblaya phenacola PAVE]|nr:DNA-binding/iron metalloprotein/AP endonuclease [Candidatus Tremblaya phenacola PAVE]
MLLVLGIETSFDDTGVAFYDRQFGLVLSIKSSSFQKGCNYGGIVPLLTALDQMGCLLINLKKLMFERRGRQKDISLLCFTMEPGLTLSLMTGFVVTQLLSYLLNSDVIPTNHITSHVASVKLTKQHLNLPLLSLVISGKTTALYYLPSFQKGLRIKGHQSSSVGEVLDKTARALFHPTTLSQSGGALISKMAHEPTLKFRGIRILEAEKMRFDWEAIRTFFLVCSNTLSFWQRRGGKGGPLKQARSAFILNALGHLSNILGLITKAFLRKLNGCQLVLSGGVSSNSQLKLKIKQQINLNQLLVCPKLIRTDNGAMVAHLGALLNLFSSFQSKQYGL